VRKEHKESKNRKAGCKEIEQQNIGGRLLEREDEGKREPNWGTKKQGILEEKSSINWGEKPLGRRGVLKRGCKECR